MAGHICKIALRTIPRCGAAALALLTLGFYVLFPACESFARLREERSTPYLLSATVVESHGELRGILEQEGVEQVTPVLRLNAVLSGEETISCAVTAVYGDFLRLSMVEGSLYPESSNMPWLLLNEAGARALGAVGDSLTMTVDGTSRKAQLCGIFDDGSDTPAACMSYDVALALFGNGGSTELLLRLRNAGVGASVAEALRRRGIQAEFDGTLTLRWELIEERCRQTLLLSLCVLLCATLLLRERRRTEWLNCRWENAMLLLSGVTECAARWCYILRLALAQGVCLAGAAVVAAFAGNLSALGVAVGCVCACAIVLLTLPGAHSGEKMESFS